LTPEFLKVKYLVKLIVHIYTFISYDQCAWNFSILGGQKNSFCAFSRALCLPRRKHVKCDFVNGLRNQDLPQHLSWVRSTEFAWIICGFILLQAVENKVNTDTSQVTCLASRKMGNMLYCYIFSKHVIFSDVFCSTVNECSMLNCSGIAGLLGPYTQHTDMSRCIQEYMATFYELVINRLDLQIKPFYVNIAFINI
jgi:hypothetical protein